MKLRHTFGNNMTTDTKLSEMQISKITQSSTSLGALLRKIAGPLMKAAVPLVKKYFSTIRNNSSRIINRLTNWKENTRLRNDNANNFKQRNEWHNEGCSSPLILVFYWKNNWKRNKRVKKWFLRNVITYFKR